jgi:hypothetical protein
MERQSQGAAHSKRAPRARPNQSVAGIRCGHRVGPVALVIVLSCMIGCSPSKSGDGKTRWTAIESDNPNQKARP